MLFGKKLTTGQNFSLSFILKASADNNRIETKFMELFLKTEKVESFAGKGENAGYQHFFPLPTKFSKDIFIWMIKTQGPCVYC